MSRRLSWWMCGTLFAVGGVLACSEPSTQGVTAPALRASGNGGAIDGPTAVRGRSLSFNSTYTSSLYPRLEPDPLGCMLIDSYWATGSPYQLTGRWLTACEAGEAGPNSAYTAYVNAYDSAGVWQASLEVTVGTPPPPPVALAGPTVVDVLDIVEYYSDLYPTIDAGPIGCFILDGPPGTGELSGAWLTAGAGACSGNFAYPPPNPYTGVVTAYDSSGQPRATLNVTVHW